MHAPLSRRSLIGTALAGALALGPLSGFARAAVLSLRRVGVRNAARRYAGDRALFATVAPGVPGRDTAVVAFDVPTPSLVRLEAVRTGNKINTVAWSTERAFGSGPAELTWTPDPATPTGSYVMRLTVEREGRRKVVGGTRPSAPERARAPVVRVLGIEASFTRRSYVAGESMELRIFADAPRLTLQFLHCGPELVSTNRSDEMSGIPMGEPVSLDWTGKRSAPVVIGVQSGPWPTGVYAARLTADDGRQGFAPFVIRPTQLGTVRQAVVVPTNTWQAYNFDDADGDGWGDTWYAGGNPPVVLDRPYRDRGVPPRYRRYDLPFLKWLHRTERRPEFITEDDLETMPSGDELRRLYDLVVFPGHTEYTTVNEYDVIQRFRDLGGRLVFLSANNFFWRVDRVGNTIVRVKKWRDLGRPEAALLGVQYRANDDGSRQGNFVVPDAAVAPWFFEGTGLGTGGSFGDTVGGYGIEIDCTTPSSPPGTQVLARVPDLFGPGVSAEMTYYETEAGARVFSAGTLDFCSTVLFFPQRRLLENVWRRLLEDVPPLPPAV